jgi:hypothetical protein
MRSGRKSLEEGVRFLDALANQLLNKSEQALDLFGVMVPRTAVSADLTPAEVRNVEIHVAQHHGLQAAPVLYCKSVLETLIKEYDRSELVPTSAMEEAPLRPQCRLCVKETRHRQADHVADIKEQQQMAGLHWDSNGDPCAKTDCSCTGRRWPI